MKTIPIIGKGFVRKEREGLYVTPFQSCRQTTASQRIKSKKFLIASAETRAKTKETVNPVFHTVFNSLIHSNYNLSNNFLICLLDNLALFVTRHQKTSLVSSVDSVVTFFKSPYSNLPGWEQIQFGMTIALLELLGLFGRVSRVGEIKYSNFQNAKTL